MRLGLIGMAGVGKSYWARRLTATGFACIDCDALTAARMRAAGLAGLQVEEDVGRWLGFPYEARYPAHEAQFVQYETQTMREIVAGLAADAYPADNLVVDMGGSAIYAGLDLFAELRRHITVVHLMVDPGAYDQLLQIYLERPRSLIWRGVTLRAGISRPEDLADDYRRLLAFRAGLYTAVADVAIEYALHRQPGWPVAAFLAQVQQAAPPLR